MFDIIIKELHTHTCDVDVLLNRIVALETNLKETVMNAKTEILDTVSTETQQVRKSSLPRWLRSLTCNRRSTH